MQTPIELGKLVAEVRGAFREESQITFAAVKELPFLTAVILEGLRLADTTAGAFNRIVPHGGGTVCGHFLPEDVRLSSFFNFHSNSPLLPP